MIYRPLFHSLSVTAGAFTTLLSCGVSLGEEPTLNAVICKHFQTSAAKINESDLGSGFYAFSSFQVVVDCSNNKYLYKFEVDRSKLSNFLRDEQFITSSFSNTICGDSALWEPAFANGWSTGFEFIGPDGENLAHMMIEKCA